MVLDSELGMLKTFHSKLQVYGKLISAYYWHCYPFIKNDLNTPGTLCIPSTPRFSVKLSPICKSNRETGIFRVPKLANTCNNIINTLELINAYNYFLDSVSLVIPNILGILIRILLETKYPALCPSPPNCDFSFRAIFFFNIDSLQAFYRQCQLQTHDS